MRNEIKELELKLRSIVVNNNAYLSEILNEEARTRLRNDCLNCFKEIFGNNALELIDIRIADYNTYVVVEFINKETGRSLSMLRDLEKVLFNSN